MRPRRVPRPGRRGAPLAPVGSENALVVAKAGGAWQAPQVLLVATP